jgi:hypothetical protein
VVVVLVTATLAVQTVLLEVVQAQVDTATMLVLEFPMVLVVVGEITVSAPSITVV